MIHGILDNCGSFESLIQSFKEIYSIVTIDLPSHGYSSHFPPGVPLQFFNFVLSIKRVIDHLNWNRFVYIGHSFGGQIGTYFSAIFPQHVEKLIVLDTMCPYQVPISQTFDHVRQVLNSQLNHEKKMNIGKRPIYSYAEAVSKIISNRPSKLTEKAAEILIKRSIRSEEGGYAFTWDQRLKNKVKPLLVFEQQVEIVSNIICPELFILSSENMERYKTTLKDMYDFNQAKENCKIVVVLGNHDVHQNYPERVSSIIEDFLK